MSHAANAELPAADLKRFCEYLYRRTGMTFGEDKRYYIERRVAERMASLRAPNFADYFNRLRSEPRELENVVNAFTVNETYFYREAHQLACLTRNILPEVTVHKGPGDRIRIWSAPCSTGEEPYSLAIWLLENWPLVDAYNVEIVGSDIDTQALADAQAGLYGERALAKLSPELVERYFEQPLHGTRELISDLRESVTFSTVNLIDRTSMERAGAFDIVFCRNVLIYFDDAARRTAAEALYDSLTPGGFLLLGHTESMARIDDRFLARRFEDAIVYQRPFA